MRDTVRKERIVWSLNSRSLEFVLLQKRFGCFWVVAYLLTWLSFPIAGAGQSQSEAELWREDLRRLAAEMPKRHKNLFHTVSREQFESAVKRLHDHIPQLARHQIIVELARLAAMVGDGLQRLIR